MLRGDSYTRFGRIGVGTRLLAGLLGAGLLGCGPSAAAPRKTPTLTASQGQGPRTIVAGPGDGPALYAGAHADAAAYGYVSDRTPLEVLGPPEAGSTRVLVRTGGALQARGWFPMARLQAYVTREGRIPGTPISLAPGDRVQVLGPGPQPGLAQVAAEPSLPAEIKMRPARFVGVYPNERLGSEPPDASALPLPGSPVQLQRGGMLRIYGRPGGAPVAELMVHTAENLPVAVVKQQGPWKAVRVGSGPYLVGLIDAPVRPAAEPVPARPTQAPASNSGVPERLQVAPKLPLLRVQPGTRVHFGGELIAVVQQRGWAREVRAYPEQQQTDAFVAVNDRVAVRGLVAANQLEPASQTQKAQGASPAPAATEPPGGEGQQDGAAPSVTPQDKALPWESHPRAKPPLPWEQDAEQRDPDDDAGAQPPEELNETPSG